METTTTYQSNQPVAAQPSILPYGVKGGLITGAISAVITIIFSYVLGLYTSWIVSVLGLLAGIIGIVLTHKGFKRDGNGYMKYSQGLILAIVLSAVAGLVAGLVSFIYINFVDPTIPEKMAEATVEMQYKVFEMIGGEITDEQEAQIEASREQVINDTGSFLNTIVYPPLIYGIGGLILGLIISAFTKENDPEVEY
jgi:hypothetical protein